MCRINGVNKDNGFCCTRENSVNSLRIINEDSQRKTGSENDTVDSTSSFI